MGVVSRPFRPANERLRQKIDGLNINVKKENIFVKKESIDLKEKWALNSPKTAFNSQKRPVNSPKIAVITRKIAKIAAEMQFMTKNWLQTRQNGCLPAYLLESMLESIRGLSTMKAGVRVYKQKE